jgi:hypothetical protein
MDAVIKYETYENYTDRDKLMQYMSANIQNYINAKAEFKYKGNNRLDCIKFAIKKLTSSFIFWTGKRLGNYLVILYVFVKFLYLANVVGQFFLMTKLLGISNYHMFGFEILRRMSLGLDLVKNHYFPKLTNCDFTIRELENDHKYTVRNNFLIHLPFIIQK